MGSGLPVSSQLTGAVRGAAPGRPQRSPERDRTGARSDRNTGAAYVRGGRPTMPPRCALDRHRLPPRRSRRRSHLHQGRHTVAEHCHTSASSAAAWPRTRMVAEGHDPAKIRHLRGTATPPGRTYPKRTTLARPRARHRRRRRSPSGCLPDRRSRPTCRPTHSRSCGAATARPPAVHRHNGPVRRPSPRSASRPGRAQTS